jgi:hypothetical protein
LCILDFTIHDVSGLQLHYMFTSSLTAPTTCQLPFEQEPPRGSADVLHHMDAQRDTKPFVSSPITATAIQRSLHGSSARQPMALLSEYGGGARVLAGLQPQAQPRQAACVLNRAASELSGGVGDRASNAGEALEGTSARSPCVAPRLSRKFWSAGDYDAAATGSAPQPPSMSPC